MHLHRIAQAMQTIRPDGFEAMGWLTRITPEPQTVRPVPMDASYGWPVVGLHTRFVAVNGFSTDYEPARRWGTRGRGI